MEGSLNTSPNGLKDSPGNFGTAGRTEEQTLAFELSSEHSQNKVPEIEIDLSERIKRLRSKTPKGQKSTIADNATPTGYTSTFPEQNQEKGPQVQVMMPNLSGSNKGYGSQKNDESMHTNSPPVSHSEMKIGWNPQIQHQGMKLDQFTQQVNRFGHANFTPHNMSHHSGGGGQPQTSYNPPDLRINIPSTTGGYPKPSNRAPIPNRPIQPNNSKDTIVIYLDDLIRSSDYEKIKRSLEMV